MSEIQTDLAIKDPDQLVDGMPLFDSLEARNEWLERLLDPRGTLPEVYLGDERPDEYGGTVTSIMTDTDAGQPTEAGECSLLYDKSRNTVSLGWVKIHEHLRGEGYGLATYLQIMEDLALGIGFVSDSTLSPDSYRIWRLLEQAGVAASDISDEEYRKAHPNLENKDELTGVRFHTVFGNE